MLRTNRYGALLRLDPDEYIDSFVLRDGFYESEVFEAARQALPDDGVFWDVGANAGYHAISMAVCKPRATIVAFEPSPRELARLVAGAALNRAAIQVLPFALDDEWKLRPFYVSQANSGRSALERWGDPATYTSTVAACVRGDDLVNEGLVPPPNVIKIDVEGAEFRALCGMREILRGPACSRVIFEGSPEALQETSPIYRLFFESGYRLRQLSRTEDTGHALENYSADRRSVV